ncbi:MAG: preprotein translocase subunit SecY [Firmicutes bacterium]|nr:preprotein translocase subunit SecY [Bacillota bacterium]
MLGALKNAFRIADLRQKLIFTALMLVVYRIGSYIPTPGVNASDLANQLGQGSIFGLLDLFAGGALGRFTIFALGVNPYITSSIIFQLLGSVIPSLQELAKEGIEGRKKIAQYTRYGTVVLAVIQAIGTMLVIQQYGAVKNPGFGSAVVIVSTLTAGTMFLMWLGELITERGIGNGISLIIFFGIIARLPATTVTIIQSVGSGGIGIFAVLAFLVIALAMIAGVIMMQEAQRRIPVQYAKRVVGRKMYGGQSTHIPLRVNQAGVIPVIFASSVLVFPVTIMQFVPGWTKYINLFSPTSLLYNVLYALLIVFFTYFYVAITFNPMDVAENLQKQAGFIPGLRPGRPTAAYIERVLSRITLVGALFLVVISILPTVLTSLFGFGAFYFGGTSLLIMVGVALDTMRQIETHLLMRHYEGFIK